MAWPEHRLLTAYLIVTETDSREQVFDAIHCFQRQSWPNKELLIINSSDHKITAEKSNVRVIETVFTGIGDLKNIAVFKAHGEWCFPWPLGLWFDSQFFEFFMTESGKTTESVYVSHGDRFLFGFLRAALGSKRYGTDGDDRSFATLFTNSVELKHSKDLIKLLISPAEQNFDSVKMDTPAESYGKTSYPVVEVTQGAHPAPSGTCIVCLGRYGDIMNALPIARHVYKTTGNAPAFLASEKFVDILDGVDYVIPHVFKGNYDQMPEATLAAKQRFSKVIRAQIYSTVEADPDCGVAHNRKAWDLAGFSEEWANPEFDLEFDRRDPVRERYLISTKVSKDPRPILLVMLTGGHSGRFDRGGELLYRLQVDFGSTFQIIDLAAIRAQRVYDLIGLYEVATALVTIDSGTMHLACATKQLPVLMLAPDDPYLAAEARCNCMLRLKYSEVFEKYGQIFDWIYAKSKPSKVWHTFETHLPTNPREKRAMSTWTVMWNAMDWQPLPFEEPYPRSSRELGDPRGVPYVNDILEVALSKADDNDIIVLTNNDIILLPQVHQDILRQLSQFPATCSSRRDIKDFLECKVQPPVDKHIHCGRDLFAFRAWWLRKHLPEVPLLLVGSNEWDNVFLNLMRRESGTLLVGQWCWEYSYSITADEMASPHVLHEAHEPFADKPENKYGPHNAWNHLRLIEWSRKHCSQVVFPYAESTYEHWLNGRIKFVSLPQK